MTYYLKNRVLQFCPHCDSVGFPFDRLLGEKSQIQIWEEITTDGSRTTIEREETIEYETWCNKCGINSEVMLEDQTFIITSLNPFRAENLNGIDITDKVKHHFKLHPFQPVDNAISLLKYGDDFLWLVKDKNSEPLRGILLTKSEKIAKTILDNYLGGEIQSFKGFRAFSGIYLPESLYFRLESPFEWSPHITNEINRIWEYYISKEGDFYYQCECLATKEIKKEEQNA